MGVPESRESRTKESWESRSRGSRKSGSRTLESRESQSPQSRGAWRPRRESRRGIECAQTIAMKARKLEDLLIYQRALEGIDAVSPILHELQRCKDFERHKQLSESSGNIPGHIGEGYGQGTDRQFAHYLCIARGSAQETRGHIANRCSQHMSPFAQMMRPTLRAFIRT